MPDVQKIAEAIRIAGIEWHRAKDPDWRDNPWKDGILMDLDEDAQVQFIARSILKVVTDA